MKHSLIPLMALLLASWSGPGRAADGQALAQQNSCLACHSVGKKIVGPAFRDVAKKYAGDKGAAARLAAKVSAGGSGVWGPAAMPPNPQVKPEDLKVILAWVLAQK